MKRKKRPEGRVTTKPEHITRAESAAAEEQEESLENPAEGVAALTTGGRKSGEHITEEGEWAGPESAAAAAAAEDEADEGPAAPAPELEHTDYSALEYEGLRRAESFSPPKEEEKPGGRRGASARRKKGGAKKMA